MVSMTRRVIPALLIAAMPIAAVADEPDMADSAKESAVWVAVFQQQVHEHLDATARARGTVICLAIDPGGAAQSPSREFMARLAGEPSVRRAAECDARPKGAVEAMTLRPAIIVTAGPMQWMAPDEVWVTVSYFRSARESAVRRYRVVRENETWVSLGPILLDGPAKPPR